MAGKTPVLLSMLILVLGAREQDSSANALPSDIYELVRPAALALTGLGPRLSRCAPQPD